MADWGSSGGVQKRVPYRPIDATTTPNSTDVVEWLDDAEAGLRSHLNAIGVTDLPADDTSNAGKLLKRWSEDYALGMVLIAFAKAAGAGDNEDGESLIKAYDDRLNDILNRPSVYGDLMSGGSGPAATKHVRGGDFGDSQITKSEQF